MDRYGEAARLAVMLVREGETEPLEAWKKAALMTFPDSAALQDKGCPRAVFLGLCSEGLIKGIPQGIYGRSSKNREYAVRAVKLLRTNKFLSSQPELLWKKVVGETISSNHQMEVVASLWRAGLICH